jgi:UDP-glucose 4-epimerase
MRPVNSEVRALLAESSRLSADTGWRPSIDLREGLKRTIAWWRDRLAGGVVRREREFII